MVAEFLVPLQYEFMVRAFLVAVVTAIICGVLSCWLVLIGWSLIGDAVSHAVLPGVVLAYWVQWPLALGAMAFGFLAVASIGVVRESGYVQSDAAIGIVFTTLFALGLVFISMKPSQLDLNHILMGNVLGVSWGDFVQIGVIAAICLAILLFKRKDFTLFAFDPVHASAIGLHPKILNYMLLGVLACTAVVALQTVGVVLVVALLITPGATARLLTDNFSRMLLLSPALSTICVMVGMYVSYFLDTAPGGTIVVCEGIVFSVVYICAPKRGLLSQAIQRRHIIATADTP